MALRGRTIFPLRVGALEISEEASTDSVVSSFVVDLSEVVVFLMALCG